MNGVQTTSVPFAHLTVKDTGLAAVRVGVDGVITLKGDNPPVGDRRCTWKNVKPGPGFGARNLEDRPEFRRGPQKTGIGGQCTQRLFGMEVNVDAGGADDQGLILDIFTTAMASRPNSWHLICICPDRLMVTAAGDHVGRDGHARKRGKLVVGGKGSIL